MRWPANNPQIGDTREMWKYAWIPTRMIDTDEWVWLEPYWELQEYVTCALSTPEWEVKRRWCNEQQ